jgi:hypothetical protein
MRPFPEHQLNSGEKVIVELRPHWLYLGWPLAAAVASVALVLGLTIEYSDAPIFVDYMLIGVLVLAWGWFAFRALHWRTTSLILTTSRLMQRTGVLTRSGLEIRLTRINELRYVQPLLGRIVGCGRLLVETGGEAGVIIFDFVRHPASVQALITEQLDILAGHSPQPASGTVPSAQSFPQAAPQVQQLDERTPPTGVPITRTEPVGLSVQSPPAGAVATNGGGASQPTVHERLLQLDDLYRRGIVSFQEYSAKKAQLIEEL